MKNILLTGVGGVTPQSIAKSLRKSKRKYKIIGVDSSVTSNGLYMEELFDKTYHIPMCTDEKYYDYLNYITEIERVDLIIISPDFEVNVVSKNRDKLNAKVILPQDSFIQVITDKIKTHEYLKESGHVPEFAIIDTEEDLKNAYKKIGTPFWIRQFVGTSGLGSLKVTSYEQAKIWIDNNEGWGKFMASEYLPGKNFGFQLIFNKGELVTSACYERKSYVMGKIAPSGISGNAAHGEFIHRDDVNDISVDSIEAICNKLNIKPHGMFTVDLKEDKNGIPRVTEINPRHIAPTYCFAEAGVNFSEIMVRIGLGEDVSGIPQYNAINPNYILLRGVDAEPVVMKKELLNWKQNELNI